MSLIEEIRSVASGSTHPFPSHHERLMTELESSEGQLGAIIRSIYEEKEQDDFLNSLSTRIKQHDRDIERMCNKNYQGFIESVTHLVKVKSEAHKLKNKVIEADKVIQESGRELHKHLKELQTARIIQRNIASSIEVLTLCIPVLETYGKLQSLMDQKHYYSALKTLEQLEHIYLPRVRGYIFSELLAEDIPNKRTLIENQSMSELKVYLEKVRSVSADIGEVAMHQVQRISRLELPPDVSELINNKWVDIDAVSTQDIIDFSPVYRCLHIHTVLGKQNNFVEEYRSHRRQQLRLAIKPPSKQVDDIKVFKTYFFNIVGFFVVEDTILHTCQGTGHKGGVDFQGLMSQNVLDDFWEMATAEVLSVLRQNCLNQQNYHLLLRIKQLIVWFCHTVLGYGFKSDKLYEVALEIREHYDELLMKTYGESFKNLLASDDYTPLTVDSEQRFQGIIEIFPFKDLNVQRAPYPKKLPFSSMVFQIFKQIKSYVVDCAAYSHRLNLSRTEIDEAVRRSVNLLLTKSMSGCLANLIYKSNLTIRQLCQLWVNIDYWENAEEDLDKYIASETKVPRSDSSGIQSRLYGFSIFKDAKANAQGKISVQLEQQIGEVMDGLTYEWTPKESTRQISPALNDVIRFMTSTFELLCGTPTKVIDNVCIHAIEHAVGLMENILLNERTPRINMEGLKSFSLDLEKLEEFTRNTASKMVPAFREGACEYPGGMADPIFARLNQLLCLFHNGMWTDYITDLTSVGITKKFSAVSPNSVYILLSKLREHDLKMKKRSTRISHKLKTKKEPNPQKAALKMLEDYLQKKNNPEFLLGARLAEGSGGRSSPVLLQRTATQHSDTSYDVESIASSNY